MLKLCFCLLGRGGHLDAKSKMTAKNNKYTPGTHWSPIRMMPARLPNALWYSIILHNWVILNQCKCWFSIGLRKGVCIIQDDDRRPSWIYGFLICVTETWVIPRTSLTVGRENISGLNKMLWGYLDVKTKTVTNQQLWECKNPMKIRITQPRLLVYLPTQLW